MRQRSKLYVIINALVAMELPIMFWIFGEDLFVIRTLGFFTDVFFRSMRFLLVPYTSDAVRFKLFREFGLTDLVRIFQEAIMNTSLQGAVNAVSPNTVTNREFTKVLGKVLHRPSLPILNLRKRLMRAKLNLPQLQKARSPASSAAALNM